MSYSGDAAEQVVRMTLEGSEVAIRLAGSGAKQLAILLVAVLREQGKTKGKARLSSMLRSGKPLKVYAVKDTDLQLFCKEAKKYGILYCVLKDKCATDGLTDIMARAEDASKIDRIIERFGLATVDMAKVKSEIERDRAEKADGPAPKEEMPEADKEAFLNALFDLAPAQQEGQAPNPTEGLEGNPSPSGPISRPKEPAGQDISDPLERSRPSIRKELKDIQAAQREQAARQRAERQKPAPHKAPPRKKAKKGKER